MIYAKDCPVCSRELEYLGVDEGDITEHQDSYFCENCHREFSDDELRELQNTADLDTQPVETIVDRGSVTIDGQFEERVTDENGVDTIILPPRTEVETLRAALRAILKEADEMHSYVAIEGVLQADCEVRDSLDMVASIARNALSGLNIDFWIHEGR